VDHFPFFLVHFPETRIALQDELTSLLQDPQCSEFWQKALTLVQQQYDPDQLCSQDSDTQLSNQYDATINLFIQKIPEESDLFFCFGLETYLREALEDALAYDALGIPFPRYGAKLLRCAPGNRIILTPTLDPVNFFHPDTTKHHQDQVVKYILRMRRGGFKGPQGPTSMTDEEFRAQWPQKREIAMQKRSPKDVRHEDIASLMFFSIGTYYNFWDRNRHLLPPLKD